MESSSESEEEGEEEEDETAEVLGEDPLA